MKINASKLKYKEQFIRYMLKNKYNDSVSLYPNLQVFYYKKKTNMFGAEKYFNSVVSLPIFYNLSIK